MLARVTLYTSRTQTRPAIVSGNYPLFRNATESDVKQHETKEKKAFDRKDQGGWSLSRD